MTFDRNKWPTEKLLSLVNKGKKNSILTFWKFGSGSVCMQTLLFKLFIVNIRLPDSDHSDSQVTFMTQKQQTSVTVLHLARVALDGQPKALYRTVAFESALGLLLLLEGGEGKEGGDVDNRR